MGSLPTEVLCSIFRLLDPIGLISASQADSKFRSIIQPNQTHFVERLLQLECGKQGGDCPSFQTLNSPILTNEEWNGMRWACGLCKRLLPHTVFGNSYLLNLQYRKPLPGSSAADAYTSWEPTQDRNPTMAQMRHIQQFNAKEGSKKIKRRYNLAVKPYRHRNPDITLGDLTARLKIFQDSEMTTFQELTLEKYEKLTNEEEQALLDQEARLIEDMHSGYKRHLRKCNECCFQGRLMSSPANEWHYGKKEQGTATVSMVTSRRLLFASALGRHFPNVVSIFKTAKPAGNLPIRLMNERDIFTTPWTMYMIRCPGCSDWHEERAFRIGSSFPRWTPIYNPASGLRNWNWKRVTPAFVDNLRCNHCCARDNGRKKLGEDLVEWLTFCLIDERLRLSAYLSDGWGRLDSLVEKVPELSENQVIKDLVQQAFRYLRKEGGEFIDYWQITLDDISALRPLFYELRPIWKDLKFTDRRSPTQKSWDELWHEHYDLIEAHLIWVINAQKEVLHRGDVLVDWALNRESNNLM